MISSIGVKVRSKHNRAQLKRLRSEGRIPAIVFGASASDIMIDVPRKEFMQWMKTGGGSVVHLSIQNQNQIPVLLEDIQHDSLTREIIHIDFLRVDATKEVRTKLPIIYTGTPIGTKQGAVVQTNSTMIEVQALPDLIPNSISADISKLEVGDSLLASELELPKGVSLVSAPEEVLINVLVR